MTPAQPPAGPETMFRRRCRRRRNRPLGGWERLGLGNRHEPLEPRALLAADVGVTIDAGHVWYMPGTEATYTVSVTNFGPGQAAGVAVSTVLGSQIANSTWTAVYPTAGSGPASGSGNIAATITLPAFGTATFSVVSRIGAAATGTLTSSATATLAGDPVAGNNSASDTLQFTARPLVLADDFGASSTSAVRVVDPATGAEQRRFFAYEPGFRGGVQAVLADVDRDGRPEVVTAPGRGRVGEIRVFTIDGAELPEYRTQPFGDGWRGGVHVAVGDVDGDGNADFGAAKASGDGEVRVFLGRASADPVVDEAFRTIRPFAATFMGGASVAFADLGTFSAGTTGNATVPDGRAELLIASGPTRAPEVQVRDLSGPASPIIDTIRPFSPTFLGGVAVAIARVNLDSVPDVLVAAGVRGNGLVEAYDGRVGTAANPRLVAFTAFAGGKAPASAAASLDTDGDGRADEILVGQPGQSIRRFSTAGAALGTLSTAAGSLSTPPVVTNPAIVTTASGLRYRDLVVGTGAKPSLNPLVRVKYEGRLLDGTIFETGTVQDPTDPTKGSPLSGLIPGWREGIASMQVGGRRQLIIPANLGYGAAGSPPKIPGNATLVFDVELLSTT